MLYIAANYIHDESLAAFAKKGADQLLKTAYLEETGSWASRYMDSTLVLDKNIMSWHCDELDQMAATLSFQDTSYYSKYLKQTYSYFEKNMINHTVGGTHAGRTALGEILDLGFRTGWHAANFHDLEHALIGYLSTANYFGDDIVLYYAFEELKIPNKSKIQPYHYNAEIKDISSQSFKNTSFGNLSKQKISFGNIH